MGNINMFMFLVFIPSLNASISYITPNSVTVSYTITNVNVCHSGDNLLSVFPRTSLIECVNECGLRPHCISLNLRRRFSICELFLTTEEGQLTEGNCIHIKGTDIVMESPCLHCVFGHTCDTSEPSAVRCKAKECLNVNDPANGVLYGNMNRIGSMMEAKCNPGFTEANGVTIYVCLTSGAWSSTIDCIDINECDNGDHTCDVNAVCINTDGGYTCACNTGYSGTGSTCTDINECVTGGDNCDVNAVCTNTDGGFTCACNTGYSGTGSTCTDINECITGGDNCDVNAVCTNTDGGFTCACNTGYSGTGSTCTDINECVTGGDNCDVNAVCTNTDGGFTCACNTGYSGTGSTCTDINECITGGDNCDVNAVCTNTDGGFTCACNTGYSGTGSTCTDVNECADGDHNCDVNMVCTNIDGGFTCACNTNNSETDSLCILASATLTQSGTTELPVDWAVDSNDGSASFAMPIDEPVFWKAEFNDPCEIRALKILLYEMSQDAGGVTVSMSGEELPEVSCTEGVDSKFTCVFSVPHSPLIGTSLLVQMRTMDYGLFMYELTYC